MVMLSQEQQNLPVDNLYAQIQRIAVPFKSLSVGIIVMGRRGNSRNYGLKFFINGLPIRGNPFLYLIVQVKICFEFPFPEPKSRYS